MVPIKITSDFSHVHFYLHTQLFPYFIFQALKINWCFISRVIQCSFSTMYTISSLLSVITSASVTIFFVYYICHSLKRFHVFVVHSRPSNHYQPVPTDQPSTSANQTLFICKFNLLASDSKWENVRLNLLLSFLAEKWKMKNERLSSICTSSFSKFWFLSTLAHDITNKTKNSILSIQPHVIHYLKYITLLLNIE